ncbi:MAG: hypothetical protein ACTSRC_09905 [Candidatus Helarchaeota archaeon]
MIEEYAGKSFQDLTIGDRGEVIAEITQIRQDEKHHPPEWCLYYLFDGKIVIRAFGKVSSGLSKGDIVKVNFDVRKGKPFNGRPQLSYKIHKMEKVAKDEKIYGTIVKKLKYQEILRKSELATLPAGTRVKLLTKVLNLHPLNGEREKFQKILIADVENRPISLWLKKEKFEIFEALSDEEYFILKARVRTVSQNPVARFLSFEEILRGNEIYRDTAAKGFLDERIRYYTNKLIKYLDLWKKNIDAADMGMELLISLLHSFYGNKYQDYKKDYQ